jgi:hypothetical protein
MLAVVGGEIRRLLQVDGDLGREDGVADLVDRLVAELGQEALGVGAESSPPMRTPSRLQP